MYEYLFDICKLIFSARKKKLNLSTEFSKKREEFIVHNFQVKNEYDFSI